MSSAATHNINSVSNWHHNTPLKHKLIKSFITLIYSVLLNWCMKSQTTMTRNPFIITERAQFLNSSTGMYTLYGHHFSKYC